MAANVAGSAAIFFLLGVAVLVGLLFFVYTVALLGNRLCCCCQGAFSALHNDAPRVVVGGTVARDAGLSGLTDEERRRVVERAMGTKTYKDPSQHQHQNAQMREEGCSAPLLEASNEMTGVASSVDVEDRTGVSQAEGSKNSTGGLLADEEARSDTPDAEEEKGQDPHQVKHTFDDTQCSICFTEYEEGDKVIVGEKCSHIFHRSCLLEWLGNQDVCPCCRKTMMTPEQMRVAAEEELGPKRLLELAMGPVMGSYECLHLDSLSVPSSTGNADNW